MLSRLRSARQRLQGPAGPGGEVERVAEAEGQALIRVQIQGGEPLMARILAELDLLTAKPVFYVANVAEDQLGAGLEDPIVARLVEGAEVVAEAPMHYAGTTSTYEARLPLTGTRDLELQVLAADAEEVNFGMDRHVVHVQE